MTDAFDLAGLLRVLDTHAVDYTIIGGVAAQAHGHRRATLDLDVVPAPGISNASRLAAALVELGASPRDMPGGSPPDADQLVVAPIVPPLRTGLGSLHILNQVPGAAPYTQLRARAVEVEYEGVTVAIAGLDDLISMKRAAGRPRDLEDIAALLAANEP